MEKSKKKKKWVVVIVAIVIVLAIAAYFLVPYVKRHFVTVSVDVDAATEMDTVDWGEKKVLTVYFTRVGNTDFQEDVDAVSSASLMQEDGELIGNSQLLAKMVQNSVGGESYAIQTQKKYPSSYNDTVSVSRTEINNDEDVELVGELPDISQYDTVVLIYPVWWGTIPNAVKSFLQSSDFSGVTIYPMITHGGSGAASSVQDIKDACQAQVSDKKLEVFDDDVTTAAEVVREWLISLQ